MIVIFVAYHNFTSPSLIHIVQLAMKLNKLGCTCYVCVPNNKESINSFGWRSGFTALTYDEACSFNFHIDQDVGGVVHAWTPRELVRKQTIFLSEKLNIPYVVHMEDNEEALLEQTTGVSLNQLALLPGKELDLLVGHALSHPVKYKKFLLAAAGATAIIDTLQDFIPPHLPRAVFWPGCEDDVFQNPPRASAVLRRQLGIDESTFCLVYPGNVHLMNRDEVFSLYLSVALLNKRGFPTKLIRIGDDHCKFVDSKFSWMSNHITHLGYMPPNDLPQYLALADVLVQPGRANAFNSYRFPSKLTIFFALGKPVLLPNTNLGLKIADNHEGMLLTAGHSLEITTKLEKLLQNSSVASQLGANARRFAWKHFRWGEKAQIVYKFYRQVLRH